MRRILKRLALIVVSLLVAIVAVLAFNTVRYTPEVIDNVELANFEFDVETAAKHLSAAVRFETDSTKPDHPDFVRFREFIEQTYPAVHATMERRLLDAGTPFYEWTGTDPSKRSVMLAAHYDVVPVSPGGLDAWRHPPYGGVIEDGFVWGRGTLDNKGAIISILTAAEAAISEGFRPSRTIYLSFGHDEETGSSGAKTVAAMLKEENVQLAWLLDEGSFVFEGVIPGLTVPVATINLAEKGSVTIKLAAPGEGGHSSMPPKITAVGRLAKAVDRLQSAPLPGGISGISEQFFDGLGRHFSFGRRIIFANRWLFGPLLETMLSDLPSTNAMLRTTTAPTMLSGSNKENVLASQATATINFRIHPRDTVESIVAHVRDVIDDEGIEIIVDREGVSPASPVSSATSEGYLEIQNSIRAIYGPIASIPGLTIARTDASYYAAASDNAYRINPFKISGDDLPRLHGINERLSLENLKNGIGFYMTLIRMQ